MRLCDATFGLFCSYDSEFFRATAFYGVPPPLAEFFREPFRAGRGFATRQLVAGESIVHIADITAIEPSPGIRATSELGGGRTVIWVALRKEETLLGFIAIYRQEVRPFSDKQIALLQNFAAQAVIAMENARLINETREALEQQTATAEVLQVINSSPGDLAPVFDAMLNKALDLCGAAFGTLWTYDGEAFNAAALSRVPAAYAEAVSGWPVRPRPGAVLGQIAAGGASAQILDAAAEEAYIDTTARAVVELGGARTVAGVALRKDGALLGAITIYRQEVLPFTDKQIALLQNFAAQAVIAMENARLLTETREALEQQTATAEVLQVINSSPDDLAPVFEAILEKAHNLCGAAHGALTIFDGELFRAVATHGVPEVFAELLRQPFRPSYDFRERLLGGERLIHIIDLAVVEPGTGDYLGSTPVELGGVRTLLFIPLRRDGTLLGYITAYRQEVRPFTDTQIALLQNFAAQAVIAVENARLLTETREALEQQTATAEVLQVINSSPGDLAPVFDAILEKARAVCGFAQGSLNVYDGEYFRTVATRGIPESFAEILRQPRRTGPQARFLNGDRIVHLIDALAEETGSDDPVYRAARAAGVRTVLFVPLRNEQRLLGYITANRREVRPFSEKEISLLENFAAQAVIAMENARLLIETQEALERQTATAEVLQVINSSPGHLTPVFDAILDKAMRLCEAEFGLMTRIEGENFSTVALRGAPPGFAEAVGQPYKIAPGQAHHRLLEGADVLHIEDITAEDIYRSGDPARRALADLAGARTGLAVALRKDDVAIGTIIIYRREVRPFTDKQIALLQNFAAQAVIAMENARLLTETREALEQQTATTEVLQVINTSPGDLAPVFDAILEKAMRLCEAAFGVLWTFEGEIGQVAALRGVPPAFAEFLRRGPHRETSSTANSRLRRGEHVVQIADSEDDDAYRSGEPVRRAMVELGGARTMLAVPLRKDATLLGSFIIYRQEVRLFSDKQIALLENFAAQAVIAMENARLSTETRDALEQQTATAEVLQVINSSPGDLVPVFDALLENAMRLCEATFGGLTAFDGEKFHTVALRGLPPEAVEAFREPWVAGRGAYHENLVQGEPLVHTDFGVTDPARLAHPQSRAIMGIGKARTGLIIVLRKDERLLGSLFFYRQEIRPFTDKQIALLENFAAQAVIAMENARLLDEIRQRQQELRVTFDNMVDGVAMFDEALRLAAWNRNFQEMLRLPDKFLAQRHDLDTYIRYLVERGEFGETDPQTQIARLRAQIGEHYSFERTRPDGTVIEVRHNPMPGGGIVLIYSDITERKRSEAEIKAARDTAEAAYRDLKAAQASLIQAEKMASLGQLTAGIAHEIKNPLNFVNNFAGLGIELLDELKETAAPAISALDDEKRAEIDETIEMLSGNLDKIAEHGRRADNIVSSMLEHSRGSSGERRSVDLNALVEEALNLAYHGGRARDQSFNITLERDYADVIAPIELVPQDITRVCLNLFGNGFYAAIKSRREGSDTSFNPMLKVSTRDLGDAVEIRVRDNGVGIPPEIKDKLFQPFFTTKPTGEGTGLGLSISYDIVTQQHGGTIEVDSRPGEFTEFTVRLPRTFGATIAQAAS
jgi:GAF domain-containing protein